MGYAGAIPRISKKLVNRHLIPPPATRQAFHATPRISNPILEPRLEDHGRVIRDEYSALRDNYGPY